MAIKMVMMNKPSQHGLKPTSLFLAILVVVCCKAAAYQIPNHQQNALQTEQARVTTRRNWLSTAAVVATGGSVFGLLPFSASAATDKLVKFRDEECGFELLVPATWEKTEQRLPVPDRRKLVIFVDPASPPTEKTLLFLAYTPVRDDFTQLSSFGSVDQVAQTTILPKGVIAGEDTQSAMLSAESKKQAYFFDYRAKPPGQVETHFRTIFSLLQGATGGAGSLLVTITAQTPESRYLDMKPLFDSVIDSYGKAT